MKLGILYAVTAIALSSVNVYGLDVNSCNTYMEYYNKYYDNYVKDTKTNATDHAKKTDSAMAKYYQDELLKGCDGVINLRDVQNNKYKIDTAYKIYQ